MSLHAVVENVVSAYLEAVDAETPGLIAGLYLTGSVALGDFRPRASDIDFVAVTAKPLDEVATAAVARANARLRNGSRVRWSKESTQPGTNSRRIQRFAATIS